MRDIRRIIAEFLPTAPLTFTNGVLKGYVSRQGDGTPCSVLENKLISAETDFLVASGALERVYEEGASRSQTFRLARRPQKAVTPPERAPEISREVYGGSFLAMMNAEYYQQGTLFLKKDCWRRLADALQVPLSTILGPLDPWKSHRTRVIQELQQYGYLGHGSGFDGLRLTTVFILDAQRINPRTSDAYAAWWAATRKANTDLRTTVGAD